VQLVVFQQTFVIVNFSLVNFDKAYVSFSFRFNVFKNDTTENFIGFEDAGLIVFRILGNEIEEADISELNSVFVNCTALTGMKDAGFMVFTLLDNGTKGADLIKLRMLNFRN